MSIIVTKEDHEDVIYFQHEWYRNHWPGPVPEGFCKISDGILQYNFVDGVHPVMKSQIEYCYREAEKSIWGEKFIWGSWNSGAGVQNATVIHYVSYVLNCALYQFDGGSRSSTLSRISGYVLQLLDEVGNMTYTGSVHGDFTLENIILNPLNGRVTFIDPAPPRILCREIDESKLMQSVVTDWEVHKRGWSTDLDVTCLPFTPTRLHWILLLTHWIRLLKHTEKHSPELIQWAKDEAIQNILTALDEEIWI